MVQYTKYCTEQFKTFLGEMIDDQDITAEEITKVFLDEITENFQYHFHLANKNKEILETLLTSLNHQKNGSIRTS